MTGKIVFKNGETYPHADVMLSQKVHNPLFNKLFSDYDDAGEALKGFELTMFFQRIKNYITQLKNDNENPLQDEFVDLVYQYLKPFHTTKMNIFNFSNMSGRKSGAKFEQTIASICDAAINALNQSSELRNYSTVVGGQGVTADIALEVGDDIKKELRRQVARLDKTANGNSLVRLTKRQQKTDVYVPDGLLLWDAEYEANDELLEFVSLIQGKSFTLKNYAGISHVGLGTSSLFRVYMSVLAYIGRGSSSNTYDNLVIYYSTQESLKHGNVGTQEHDTHIRSSYELVGLGQATTIGKLVNMPDYLIVNERNGNAIKVYSTKKLIYDAVQTGLSILGNDINNPNKIVFNATV